MNPDLDREMAFWCELLGLTPDNGWQISWRWVDDLRTPAGGPAYGLNQVDGDAQTSDIMIRTLRNERDALEFQDTCAHEAVHCLGARMQALLDAGREVDAHEYLAEVFAPAMVKIRNTPRAKSFARAVRQLPVRAKGKPKMDALSLLLALCKGLMGLANLPEEARALIEPVIAEASAATGNGDGAAPSPEGGMTAEPPPPGSSEERPPPVAAAAPLQPGYAKAAAVLIAARPDLTESQREYVRTHCKTVEGAAGYIATIPVPAPPRAPVTLPAAAPLSEAPRGAEIGATKLLSKKNDRLVVAKAMGQATEPKSGPAIVDKPGGGGRYFTLGSMTPREYRAKRATGWDPRKDFPIASEVA